MQECEVRVQKARKEVSAAEESLIADIAKGPPSPEKQALVKRFGQYSSAVQAALKKLGSKKV